MTQPWAISFDKALQKFGPLAIKLLEASVQWVLGVLDFDRGLLVAGDGLEDASGHLGRGWKIKAGCCQQQAQVTACASRCRMHLQDASWHTDFLRAVQIKGAQ